MIKNEKQYKITKAQANSFQSAINNLTVKSNLSPLLQKAQEDALKSQHEELLHKLLQYEMLRSGTFQTIELSSFDKLPLGLIKARIARGLSHKDLAEKLGLKEQQIQRYEATEYASASFERIKEVINALDIKVKEDIFFTNTSFSENTLVKKLSAIGISKDFFIHKLLPSNLALQFKHINELVENEASNLLVKIGAYLSSLFGFEPDTIFSDKPLQVNINESGFIRFKKTVSTSKKRISAYTLYAQSLALNLLAIKKFSTKRKLTTNAEVVRAEILDLYGEINFENALRYIWELGIPVIALNDTGSFHGACWRVNGENVIVLKQKTMSEARWLFDLLHELFHASQNPEQESLEIIEEDESSRQRIEDDDEIDANYFAADIILGENADDIIIECINKAKGNIENLKNIVPNIAIKHGVDVGALANFLAFRLAEEKKLNWWGAASNLQLLNFTPWELAKKLIFENCDLDSLNEYERELLLKAIL